MMQPTVAAPASASSPNSARRPWQVLAIVSAGVFMASLDVTIVNIAFPDIAADFAGTSLASLSWILNAYAIVFAALLVPAGRVADRIGRKRGFLAGLSLFILASALCAVAVSPGMLIATRIVQAVGAAMLVPTSLALLLPEFPVAKRPLAVGIWGATGGIAAALGPSLGGLLVEADWRWVFLVNVPFGIAAGVAGRRVLVEARESARSRLPDLAGAAMLALAVGLLSLGIVKGPDWGWDSTQVVASFAAAAGLTALFFARSARHPAPVVELGLLRVRSFAAATTAVMLFSVAFFAMLLATVLFLTQVWDYSTLRAGLAISPGPLTAALFSVIAGRLAERFGQRAVATPGPIVFALGGFLWLESLGTQPDYLADFLPGMIIGGVGVGLTLATLASAATSSLPADRLATGSAIFQMARQIGAVLGIAILVAILGTPDPADPAGTFDSAWAFMIVSSLGAGLVASLIGRIGTAEAPARAPIAAPVPEEAAS
jgi:EmrB/QacA subfamily drug resistance transporter